MAFISEGLKKGSGMLYHLKAIGAGLLVILGFGLLMGLVYLSRLYPVFGISMGVLFVAWLIGLVIFET